MAPDSAATTMRRFVLAILVLGLAGTATELLLIGHDEDWRQMAPIVLVGAALGGLAWQAIRPGRAALRMFCLAMVLMLASGAAGVVLHYRANMEFQLEIDPSISGSALFWKVVRAKAPPAMAPGVMAQLGLLGLLFTYRHPAWRGSSDAIDTEEGE